MSAETVQDQIPASARKLPAAGTVLRWRGRVLRMTLERGSWRVRCRAKGCRVDIVTGTPDLAQARRIATTALERDGPADNATAGTLAEVAAEYMRIPRKCSDDTAADNVARLRSVVAALGKTLETVKVDALPALWHDYVAARQALPAPNYSRRERINTAINSALRQAASIFRPKLHVHYRRAGITLPRDASAVEYLPVMAAAPAPVDDAGLVAAWEGLRESDPDMWLAIGLARFAGLRQSEILACRGRWIVRRGAGAVVELQDRDEDHFRTKTGRRYSAIIMHAGLAEYLLAMPPEALVITRADALNWIGRQPQAWLRRFTGAASKPLHRCRGLYADHVRRVTEDAILARAAGTKAASESLGHTTTATTERHYLSD